MNSEKVKITQGVDEENPNISFYDIEVLQDETIINCPFDGHSFAYKPPTVKFRLEFHNITLDSINIKENPKDKPTAQTCDHSPELAAFLQPYLGREMFG